MSEVYLGFNLSNLPFRFTAVKPQDRQKKILDNLMKNNKKYKDDPYAREFGINVSGEVRGWSSIHYHMQPRNCAFFCAAFPSP